MLKPKRKKLVKFTLEGELSKIERRIQKLAENAYQIRQAISALDALEQASQPKTTQDQVILEAATLAGNELENLSIKPEGEAS